MKEGWSWLYNSPKYHYFREGRSLCKRWMILGPGDFEQDWKDDMPDNCAGCQKKLLKNPSKNDVSSASRQT